MHTQKIARWAVPGLLVALALTLVAHGRTDSSYALQVEQGLDAVMETVYTSSSDAATMDGLSSNPYDYVMNNAAYAKLVGMGYSALPALEAQLRSSTEDGLREYIICIAIEDITNCDLKQFGGSTWDRASVFAEKWASTSQTCWTE